MYVLTSVSRQNCCLYYSVITHASITSFLSRATESSQMTQRMKNMWARYCALIFKVALLVIWPQVYDPSPNTWILGGGVLNCWGGAFEVVGVEAMLRDERVVIGLRLRSM